MRSFRHARWQHLDYRVKVATTQENKPPTQGTHQWTFTTPRWRCRSILLPSLNAGVPEPIGGGYLWNSTQNILSIYWKIWFLYNVEILRALRFKSSYSSLKCPPGAETGILLDNSIVADALFPDLIKKMLPYQYRKSNCGDKAILWPSPQWKFL